MRLFAMTGLAVPLAGCSPLGEGLGRVVLLVLLPLGFVGLLLWAMARQRRRRSSERDRRNYPDYQRDRDDGQG